ncbi:MAG: hypothetical protein M0R06_17685 [Sphaerochaeta sp.]|jgi:hypothetical protein|nr:hypothetical protein [Sphaerochaeta sp.]
MGNGNMVGLAKARPRKGELVRVGKKWVRKPKAPGGGEPLKVALADGRFVKATQLSDGRIVPEKRSLR